MNLASMNERRATNGEWLRWAGACSTCMAKYALTGL